MVLANPLQKIQLFAMEAFVGKFERTEQKNYEEFLKVNMIARWNKTCKMI